MDMEKDSNRKDREPERDERAQWVKPGVDAQETLASYSLACSKAYPWTCPPQRTS